MIISIVDTFGSLEFKICNLYYTEGKTIQQISEIVKKRMTYVSAVVAECKEQYDIAKLDGNAIQTLPVTEKRREDCRQLEEHVEEKLEILVFNTMPEQILGMEQQLQAEERDIEVLLEEARQFSYRDSENMKKMRAEDMPAKSEEDIRNFKEMQKIKKAEAERIAKKIGIFNAASKAKGNIFKKRKEVYQVASNLLGISTSGKAKEKKPSTKISMTFNADMTGGKSLKNMKVVKDV